eukprot:6077368-Ditylum_brightwellii.AAC.1
MVKFFVAHIAIDDDMTKLTSDASSVKFEMVSFYWSSKRSTYNMQVNSKGFPLRKSPTGVIWKATVLQNP